MAIIEELGLEVKVKVNGSTAAEYPDEEPDADDNSQGTCSRYVESVDNAAFFVQAGVLPGPKGPKTSQEWFSRSQNHALSFTVAIDGGHAVEAVLVDQNSGPRRLEGIRNTADKTMRKFRFAPVSIVDDATKTRVATDTKVAQDLGLIRVCVHRVIVKTRNLHRSPLTEPELATDRLSLAEKALKGKAISHGTTLSDPIKCNDKRCDVEYVDPGASPLAVFYFKYRSKEALQQLLIITRPRSLSIESDVENLSPDEIRRLARERLSQMKGNKKRAIAVKNEDDAEVPKSGRPFKLVRIEGGKKAIDLTGDD
ncbi:hypothetical protein Daus18300_010971 [Diaporthe australafricana]|uniref:DUF7918 domain-containing protein n=1 Tax=Diaporthe australafricana TaxID=127596 RepID=A0ABR3W8Y9_9PEZI